MASISLLTNVTTVSVGASSQLVASPVESFSLSATSSGGFKLSVTIEQSSDNITFTKIYSFIVNSSGAFTDSFSVDVATGYYVRARVDYISGTGTSVSVLANQGAYSLAAAQWNVGNTALVNPITGADVGFGVTSITNADAYAAQFVGKFIRSKQYRNFPAVAAQRRLAFYQKSRVLAIVRNLSATETIRIATTAVDNGNRNAPAYADGVYGTDSPKSKYMLIPPLQAYITTYDPSQIWSKSTANVNNICIELWSLP